MNTTSAVDCKSPKTGFAVQISNLVYQTDNCQFSLSIDHFEMPEKSTLALTGRSGSGKTTLLSLISGQIWTTHGAMKIIGRDLNSMSVAQIRQFRLENIGIVFQDFRLIDYLRVRDNIGVARNLGRIANADHLPERINQLAEQFGISNLLNRYPHQISQGERQRTAIARAMFTKPSLILADEPTGNLDPQNAETVLNLLIEANKENQSSLLMVTHDHTLLNRFDRHIDMTQIAAKPSPA